MDKRDIALLEYDTNPHAKFSPADYDKVKVLPEKCVISFACTAVEEVAQKYGATQAGYIGTCSGNHPVYVVNVGGEELALVCGIIGAAAAASELEELIAMGAKEFVVCGAAGTLTPNPLGALVVVERAVRDEGTSFHYAPPSYEIEANSEAVADILRTLKHEGIPCTAGKTWTTDGIYRETEDKIALRREQGCVTVEMEASALIAAARLRGVKLGQILYCGDDLSSDKYDTREFDKQTDIRRNLTEWSLQCVKNF